MRQFSDIHKHSWVFLVFDTYLKMIVLVSQKLSPKRWCFMNESIRSTKLLQKLQIICSHYSNFDDCANYGI